MEERTHKPLLGILLRACSAFCFALMAVAVKFGHATGSSPIEIVIARALFALPLVLAWVGATPQKQAWRTKRPWAHVWRAALGLTVMAAGYPALRALPLTEASAISFAAPVFAVILSALILKEWIGWHRWSAVLFGFLGILIVTQPGQANLPMQGIILAILAALGTGALAVTIRKLGETETTQTSVLWFTLLTVAVMLPAAAFYLRPHDLWGWSALVMIGLSGALAQIFHTASLRFAPVSVVMPFDYMQMLWALVFGWYLFSQYPPPSTLIGGGIILVSGFYIFNRERGNKVAKPA